MGEKPPREVTMRIAPVDERSAPETTELDSRIPRKREAPEETPIANPVTLTEGDTLAEQEGPFEVPKMGEPTPNHTMRHHTGHLPEIPTILLDEEEPTVPKTIPAAAEARSSTIPNPFEAPLKAGELELDTDRAHLRRTQQNRPQAISADRIEGTPNPFSAPLKVGERLEVARTPSPQLRTTQMKPPSLLRRLFSSIFKKS